MGSAQLGAGDANVVELDHWIYGVVEGVGYTTKGVSQGLNVGLYDTYLRGHYTPIRAATVQSEGIVDLQMIHPVRSADEVLFSRVGRGPPDEAGRPTFTNHTAIVPVGDLRSGRISLEAVARALDEFEKVPVDFQGEMNPLNVAARPEADAGSSLGAGAHRYLSLPSLETLATRMIADPRCRTLLLSRDSIAETRNKTLYLVVEILNLACGLPLFPAISDAPTASALNAFNLVVAARGVRADASWALLESSLNSAPLPRIPGQDTVYDALATTFRTARPVRSTR